MSTQGLDLQCRELVELVTDYLTGVMPASERARFEQHLLQCGSCRRYLGQMRTTIGLTGRLRDDAVPPPPVAAKLLDAFRRRKQGGAK